MTDELVAFLQARLDEDERDVRNGYLTARPIPDYDGWDKSTTAALPPAVAVRLLDEIGAKRRIVAECGHMIKRDEPERSTATWILGVIALPYRDHPNYRSEWAQLILSRLD